MTYFALFRGISNIFLTTINCPSLNGLCNKMAMKQKTSNNILLKFNISLENIYWQVNLCFVHSFGYLIIFEFMLCKSE